MFVTHPFLLGVSPQDIPMVLWICAKLPINPGGGALNTLLTAMARSELIEKASPQNLSNCLWAVSEPYCSAAEL